MIKETKNIKVKGHVSTVEEDDSKNWKPKFLFRIQNRY